MSNLDNMVTVNLDKERHLRLTLKGMIAFEKLTGKPIQEEISFTDFSLKDTAALLWACLLHEDNELTYDDVISMVDLSNMGSLIQAVMSYVNQSAPEADITALVRKARGGTKKPKS